ncbi:hypothetical protein KSP40_PGU012438 [Platanthera guangdongensis]|uniref:Uncharacterized protein n=1 Tax=Platanthera guangdongensis TaxID=2320717 RepID=A0ABR2LUE5_9ASPA
MRVKPALMRAKPSREHLSLFFDDVSSEMNSYCRSSGEQFESCSYGEDSGISEALPSSKVEAEFRDMERSLVQGTYYEALLQNAKEKRARHISEAVESAVGSKIQGIQLEIEKVIKEKNYLAENQNFIKMKIGRSFSISFMSMFLGWNTVQLMLLPSMEILGFIPGVLHPCACQASPNPENCIWIPKTMRANDLQKAVHFPIWAAIEL